MTACPECNEAKERIAQHWAMSACGYPEIADAQRAVLDGLFLSGAAVAGNGNNRHLTIGTTSEALAEWTADQLDWLHHGTRVDRGDAGRDDVYRVRTPAHPACNRYEKWRDGDTRDPPPDFELVPLAGRVWWAYAGGLEWHGDHDSQRTATISALDDDRAAWITRVLATAGVEATRAGKRVQWQGKQVRDWLDWIGDPVPGVAYKWAVLRDEYEIVRATSLDATTYWESLAKTELEYAREQIDGVLNPAAFEQVTSVLTAADVVEILGGESWDYALYTASVPAYTIASPSDLANPKRARWTLREMAEALRGWAADADSHRVSDYKDDARNNDGLPSADLVNLRFGSWTDALDEVLDTEPQYAHRHWTKDEVESAFREWLGGHPAQPSQEAYMEAAAGNPQLPNYHIIDQYYGSFEYAVRELWDS